MNRTTCIAAVALLAAAVSPLVNAQAPEPRVFEGKLVSPATPDGERPRAEHSFTVLRGQRIEVRLESDDFDTVLELNSPDGLKLSNDDFEGSNSRLTAFADRDGTWRAVVSAYGQSSGAYLLEVSLSAAGQIRTLGGPGGPEFTAQTQQSPKGRRFDTYRVTLANNTRLLVQMKATDFEPMLIATGPGGARLTTESSFEDGVLLDVPLAERGEWVITATHADDSPQTGKYSLTYVEFADTANVEVRRGTLRETDPQEIGGEHYHRLEIRGTAGRPLLLDLVSTDFDAYLAVRSPAGEWHRDDDGGGGENARLSLPPLDGVWTVYVTTYDAGETGAYQLSIRR